MKKNKNLFILVIIAFLFIICGICTSIFDEKEFVKENVKKETISNLSYQDIDKEEITIESETTNVLGENVVQEEEKQKVSEEPIKENYVVKSESLTVVPETVPTVNQTQQSISSIVVDPLETVKQNADVLGTVGRLFLPSVDFNVGVYSADISDGGNAQKIVDDRDSAAYFQMGNQTVIADHNHQGFRRIIDISVGDKAYLKKTDGQISVYRMTQKFEGMNLGQDLTDLNGNSVFNGDGSLIMYTCYKTLEYDNHVMVTIWQLEY